jgi:hypothetical protein
VGMLRGLSPDVSSLNPEPVNQEGQQRWDKTLRLWHKGPLCDDGKKKVSEAWMSFLISLVTVH